jgi:hypothetical protein
MKEIMEEYKPLLEGVEVEELTEDVKERQTNIRLGKPQTTLKKEVIEVDYSVSSSSSSSSEKSSSESEESHSH